MSASDAPPQADSTPNYFTDAASPLAPYFLRAWHLVGLVLLAAVFLVLNFSPLWHTDTWGHLKFGQWIVEQRRLPEHEPFCDLADKESPYVAFGWLSQVGFYLVFRLGELSAGGDELNLLAGGVEMLRGLHALLSALRWGILLLALRRASGSMPLACLGTFFSMVLMWANYGVLRPQVVVEPLFAALLLFVSQPLLSRRALIAAPLLMALWSNLHGSFLVGLAFLGCVFVGRIVELWVAEHGLALRKVRTDSQICRLALALLTSAVAVAILNPHREMLYAHTLNLANHPNIGDMDEWQGIDWSTGRGVLYGGSLGVIALTLALRLNARRESTASTLEPATSTGLPTHVLLLLLFGVQTLLHQRMMHWWGMLVPWVLVQHWRVLAENVAWLRADGSMPSFKKTVLAVALWVLALRFWGPTQVLLDRQPRPLERSLHAGTPWKLAAVLASGGRQAPESAAKQLPALTGWLSQQPGGRFPGRVFCTETQGDYLLWSLPSEVPISVYTHVHLFPPETWKELQRIKFGDPVWQAILDRYGVNLVVFEPEFFPKLRNNLLNAKDEWLIVLDETGAPTKHDKSDRLLIAVRKNPR